MIAFNLYIFAVKVNKIPNKLNNMSEKPNVLYVDDEPENLTSFRANFRRHFTIFTADNAREGMGIFEKEDIHVLLTDQKMPGMTGIDFLREAVKLKPEIPRIIVTAYSDINVVVEGVNDVNIFKFIQKPWNIDYFKQSIEQAFEMVQLRRDNMRLLHELKRVNGQLEFYLRQKLLS
jgi:DNA-binding NtrC family response regulator